MLGWGHTVLWILANVSWRRIDLVRARQRVDGFRCAVYRDCMGRRMGFECQLLGLWPNGYYILPGEWFQKSPFILLVFLISMPFAHLARHCQEAGQVILFATPQFIRLFSSIFYFFQVEIWAVTASINSFLVYYLYLTHFK